MEPELHSAMQPAAGAEFLATRASLLGRLKDLASESSWQEFFDTYWRLIYATARRAGLNSAEAEDAVQDTMLAVSQHIQQFRYDPAKCSFKSWLLLITRQRIIWQVRKRIPAQQLRRADTGDEDIIDQLPDPANIESTWDAEWERNLMTVALERVKRQVKPKQFQIFDLYVLQHWPAADVARTMKVNIAQIYLAKHRVGWLLKNVARSLASRP